MIGYKVVLNNNKNIDLSEDVIYDTNEKKTKMSIGLYNNGFFMYPSLHVISVPILGFSSRATASSVKIITVETDDDDIISNKNISFLTTYVETNSIKRTDDMKEISPVEYVNGVLEEYTNATDSDVFNFLFNNFESSSMSLAFMAYMGIPEEDIKRALKIAPESKASHIFSSSIEALYTGNTKLISPLSTRYLRYIAYNYGLARNNGDSPVDIYQRYASNENRSSSITAVENTWIALATTEINLFSTINTSRYFKNR